jgi:ketosteroid isomerase-like protein
MDYEQLLDKAKRALIGLDVETLVSLYAPQCILLDVPSGAKMTTMLELKAYYERLFAMQDIAFTDVSFFAAGDQAAGEWTWHGRSPARGKAFSIHGASLFKLGEEGILEESLFYDPRPALE